MAAHVNRKEYIYILIALAVLTALEIGLAVPHLPIPRPLVVIGLIALATLKAACVALFYMHLKYETRILRWTVVLPLLMPPVYALVLMAEAAIRMGALK